MNIPYGRHHTNKADLEAVIDVLQGGMLTQGPLVPKFEACLLYTSDAADE